MRDKCRKRYSFACSREVREMSVSHYLPDKQRKYISVFTIYVQEPRYIKRGQHTADHPNIPYTRKEISDCLETELKVFPNHMDDNGANVAQVLMPADIACSLFSGISVWNVFRFCVTLVITLCLEHKYRVIRNDCRGF